MFPSSSVCRSLLAATAAFVVAAEAPALLIPLTQARSIAAEGSIDGNPPSSNTSSAPGFGPFDDARQVSDSSFYSFMASLAEQHSSITFSEVLVEGRTEVGAYDISGTGEGSAGSSADSLFSLTFQLATAQSWDFEVTLSHIAFGFVTGGTRVELSGGSTSVVLDTANGDTGIDTTLALAPAVYTLTVNSSLDASTLFGEAGDFVTVRFAEVPEPGTLVLLGAGIAGLLVAARRRKA